MHVGKFMLLQVSKEMELCGCAVVILWFCNFLQRVFDFNIYKVRRFARRRTQIVPAGIMQEFSSSKMLGTN